MLSISRYIHGRDNIMIKYLLTATMIFLPATTEGTDEWSLDYDVYTEGPRTVFEGTARLYADEDSKFPCMSYCFDLPEGRLAGPVISSNPNEPMIPFDWWERSEGELEVVWCRETLPLNPLTGEDLQTYPIEIPRHFKFYIIKTEFYPDDITKLLSEWLSEDSAWDLNGDGIVNGGDLAIALGGWKVD
jgi:hypothetical protein